VSPLVAVAFGAGLLAPVNPCGFALLPAYLSTFLHPGTTSGPATLPRRLRTALLTGAAITAGFVVAVTAVGAVLAAGLRSVIHVMPWLAAIVGLALVLAGVVMLLGRRIPIRVPGIRPVRTPASAPRRSSWRLVGFGVGYALASASCTLAILLAVVTQAVTAETLPGIIAVFAANAAGSALVLLALAVAAALADTALSTALGRVARYLPRVSGALLAASGAYLLTYWLPHLDGSSPTQKSGLDRISARATTWISDHQTLVATTALVVIVVAAVGATLTLRRARQPEDCCDTTTEPACTDEPATATTSAT